MKSYETKTISKISVARGQLKTAIELYFQESEPVAVHALAANAQAILSDLYRKRGLISPIENCIAKLVKTEKQDEVRKAIKGPKNYIKHANKDPDEYYEFRPAQAQFVIWEACEMYKTLTKETPKWAMIYWLWFYMHHQDVLTHPTGKQLMQQAYSLYRPEEGRAGFYKNVSAAYDIVAPEFPNILTT
ncbi:MAG: hypothetical protein G01um101413_970 [Parcubacteria group bacterium Gr01-1014_13]|nr:MAG: hypothetical protein G01um101413_970 [Parcubacteria group bacterium Gr01-1014_13]